MQLWILNVVICIIGSLPLVTAAITLYSTQFRHISLFLFTVSGIAIVMSLFKYIQDEYIYIIILALLVLNIAKSIFMWFCKKHILLEDNSQDDTGKEGNEA